MALTNKDGTSQTSKESIAAGGVAAAGTAAANAGTVFPTDPSGDWSSHVAEERLKKTGFWLDEVLFLDRDGGHEVSRGFLRVASHNVYLCIIYNTQRCDWGFGDFLMFGKLEEYAL